jgi:hypothetical protein
MRLDRILTAMLLQIDPSCKPFVEPSGCLVVLLDKALYGCVEAAKLWYEDLRAKLLADGFTENPYDLCVFNKIGADGKQVTIVVHVDDLLVTCVVVKRLQGVEAYLRLVYKEIKVNSGKVLNYTGMTLDFTVRGQARVTMANCVNDIITTSGVTVGTSTPASVTLFDVRDTAPKASDEQCGYFHIHVAKVLYVAKRVRPECLTAVAFLSTRVHACDLDDMSKLERLLSYILAIRERGITLRIGVR